MNDHDVAEAIAILKHLEEQLERAARQLPEISSCSITVERALFAVSRDRTNLESLQQNPPFPKAAA